MRQLAVTLPQALVVQLDQEAKALRESRERFIGRAVEERIERLRQERDELLAEAYRCAKRDPSADPRPWLAM